MQRCFRTPGSTTANRSSCPPLICACRAPVGGEGLGVLLVRRTVEHVPGLMDFVAAPYLFRVSSPHDQAEAGLPVGVGFDSPVRLVVDQSDSTKPRHDSQTFLLVTGKVIRPHPGKRQAWFMDGPIQPRVWSRRRNSPAQARLTSDTDHDGSPAPDGATRTGSVRLRCSTRSYSAMEWHALSRSTGQRPR